MGESYTAAGCASQAAECSECRAVFARNRADHLTCGPACSESRNVRLKREARAKARGGGWPARPCTECGAAFTPVKRRDLTCSRACSLARKNSRRMSGAGPSRPAPPPPAPPRVIPCGVCGAEFPAPNSRSRYCSPACGAEADRRRTLRRASELTCTECGATFRPVGQAVTCSPACSLERSRRFQRDYAARLRARTAAGQAAAPGKEARRRGPSPHPADAPVMPRLRSVPVAPRRRRPPVLPACVKTLWADLARLRLTARRPDEFAAIHLRACYAAEGLAGQEREAALWLMDEARAEARRR